MDQSPDQHNDVGQRAPGNQNGEKDRENPDRKGERGSGLVLFSHV